MLSSAWRRLYQYRASLPLPNCNFRLARRISPSSHSFGIEKQYLITYLESRRLFLLFTKTSAKAFAFQRHWLVVQLLASYRRIARELRVKSACASWKWQNGLIFITTKICATQEETCTVTRFKRNLCQPYTARHTIQPLQKWTARFL